MDSKGRDNRDNRSGRVEGEPETKEKERQGANNNRRAAAVVAVAVVLLLWLLLVLVVLSGCLQRNKKLNEVSAVEWLE